MVITRLFTKKYYQQTSMSTQVELAYRFFPDATDGSTTKGDPLKE